MNLIAFKIAEEELKRFYAEQSEYGAVGLNYDESNDSGKVSNNEESATQSNDEEKANIKAFVPIEKLNLPIGMFIVTKFKIFGRYFFVNFGFFKPETCKQNSIIEKTAGFVASQGLQMEILIKAKQSGNAQFDFLNYDDQLNAYYKHLVEMIKSGKYVPELEDEAKNAKKENKSVDNSENSDSDDGDDSDGDHYLHPLLAKAMNKPSEPEAQKFKPNIKDTAYQEIIEKFQS